MKDKDRIVVVILTLVLAFVLTTSHTGATGQAGNPASTPQRFDKTFQQIGAIHISIYPPAPTTNDVIQITASGELNPLQSVVTGNWLMS